MFVGESTSGPITIGDAILPLVNEEKVMKPFTVFAVVVFACVALLQLVRFFEAWPVSINGFAVPVWASAMVFIIATMLAVMLWRENRR
jgi:hypothetical protein